MSTLIRCPALKRLLLEYETMLSSKISPGFKGSGFSHNCGIWPARNRGADHNMIWCVDFFTGPDKSLPSANAKLAFMHQCYRSACDLLGVCRLISYQIKFDFYSRMLSEATGWHISENDIIRTSERVFNLTRAFNVREDFIENMVPYLLGVSTSQYHLGLRREAC